MDLVVGQLVLFASNFTPAGTLACDGSTAPIEQWPELAELLGTTFGGDGTTTFGLPNIPSASMRWVIVTDGPAFGSGQFGLLGEVRPMVVPPPAGSSTAETWLPCDGRELQINRSIALYALLGTTFGGDGRTTFAVPNLPPLAGSISWWIAQNGMFPGLECDPVTPTFPSNSSLAGYLASVTYLAYDSSNIAKVCGFALCRGQSVPIVQPWLALFSLLGNTFGGDGRTAFNLPSLPALGGVTPAIVVNGVYPSRS
jgi:microcystin-dependent protein